MAICLQWRSNCIVSLSSSATASHHLTLAFRAVIGSLGASYIADKIGRKLVYLIGFVFVLVGITVETIATTNTVFFAGKFINGFAVGAFGTITMTYVGEVC